MRNYRRRPQKPQINHADDWLMTYADMITLLLCFFAVFLSVSAAQKYPKARVQKAAVVYSTEAQKIAEYQVAPLFDPAKVPNGIRIAQKSDTVTTLEMPGASFFDDGSAMLSDAGKSALHDLAASLKSDSYREHKVSISCHTDDKPIISERFPSNWELSSARAGAIVHFLLEEGIAPQRLSAAGYGDAFPKEPNRDANGTPIPENRAQNNRIMIDLERMKKA